MYTGHRKTGFSAFTPSILKCLLTVPAQILLKVSCIAYSPKRHQMKCISRRGFVIKTLIPMLITEDTTSWVALPEGKKLCTNAFLFKKTLEHKQNVIACRKTNKVASQWQA